MTDFAAQPAAKGNIGEYSVTELSAALRKTVEDRFGYVRVRGEISGFKGAHSSGHAYFALKDAGARLEAVVWRLTMPKLRFKPQEGVEVIATGKLTTFPGQSKYQLVIEAMEPAGVGALMALLDARRKALAGEGLFAEARKKALPYLPRVIGVVTSPTGAVIRDILHRLGDRFPTRVILWPVRVQGETAAAEVAAAIAGFNAFPAGGRYPRPDLIIVARGGGSLEDLWAFNEEVVVRAAAASTIPLVSAVGHETDFTLIDLAADKRAPTPTAAAEMAVPVRSELVAAVDGFSARLSAGALRQVEAARRELRAAARALPKPEDLLAEARRRADDVAGRIGMALIANARAHRAAFERAAGRLSLAGVMRMVATCGERLAGVGGRVQAAFARRVERLGAKLAAAEKLLEVVSYRSVLARGFALVSVDGEPVRSAAAVPRGKRLDIEFGDGHVAAVSNGLTQPPKRRRGGGDDGSQGSLL
ncbi:MAG TPA: exodeoxyribonuclease VII large subunit [Bauldia sp.]|nr:exodeoxyribonuclease VII large subunit [Bauldia sp.]